MIELTRPLTHYQSRSMKVLTPLEQDQYLNSQKQYITIEIDKNDHDLIKKYRLNMSRIVFFLIKDWLEKKVPDWDIERE